MAEDKTVSSRMDFESSTGGVSSNGSATAGSSASQAVLDTTGPKMRVDPEDTTQRGYYTSTAPIRLLDFPVVPAVGRPAGRFNARSSLRTQWINKILADLRDIQPHCDAPEMAVY